MPGKLYGEDLFDPKFIINQILLLQSIFYLTLSTFILLFNQIFGIRYSLGQIFSAETYNLQDSYSLSAILSHILTALVLIFCMVLIVERAKKCFDYGSTLYLLHFIITWCINSFPLSLLWWGFHLGYMVVVVLGSEYFCMKIEQREIALTWMKPEKPETP